MDELLCDSLTKSKHIFADELAEIVDKCTDNELKLITETVKAIYDAIHGKLG